jgi:RNA polymerase sigma-70 factor (ECF subfamily)
MTTSTFPISLFDSTPIPAFPCQRPASPAKPPLDDVLVRAQAGNHDAFSQLYLLHKKRVFGICLRMVRDFSMAEDLTQETFLQLHRKLTSFRGESLFTTWLHRMTVNIVLMRLRKRVLPVVSLDQMMTDIPEEHVGRSFGTWDRKQTGAVDRISIERAVDTLAPGYRNVFLLHDVQGLEHREIASQEGCSLGNSKSQLHKARRALRGALAARSGQGFRTRSGSTPVDRNSEFQRGFVLSDRSIPEALGRTKSEN